MLPALALSVSLVAFGLGCASNVLSRQVEASADSFSLHVNGDPHAFIAFQRDLAIRNISDPDPPAPWQLLFGTHPTAVERIGIAKAYESSHR
jgi:Zn-dependent protease with chaperone function